MIHFMFIEKSLLVCGSVHIDIIARSKYVPNTVRRPGSIVFDIGGAANNIAMAARGLGVPVKILTALAKNSPYTNIIVQHLNEAKVDICLQQEDNLPDAAFCAHFDDEGVLRSAISSLPIEQVDISRSIFEPAIDDARGLILNCNLSSKTIFHMTHYANSVGVPVFMSVSSEEKIGRIARSGIQFAGLFMNHNEMTHLSRHLSLNPSAFALAKHFSCPVIVTHGNNGAILAHQNDPDALHFDTALMGDIGGEKDYMGAGDVVVAHTVAHHLFGLRTMQNALTVAMIAAEESASIRHLNLLDGGGMSGVIQSINKAAALDHLTNLPNRNTATKKLEQLTVKNVNCFIAMVDIDFFKRINDTYGHDVGDTVIKKVAETISSTMRESDFCARWGGEEFLCIIGRGINTIEEARGVMERTRRAVELIKFEHATVTISIGIASTANGVNQAIKRADEALYTSKKNGRNRVSLA